MSKILVFAEKPSVGKDIAKVLNARKGGNGFLEGDKYVVTWAMGHLVSLAPPEAYNKEWKDWKMEALPMLPPHMKLEVLPKTARQYSTVKGLLNRNDITSIIIATDAGREGELVARWTLEKVGCRKPIKRLWISSVTDKAIRDGFNTLKDGRLYENLYRAAEARAEADWIIGLNATRALTCKHNAQLSCGRVQTPTVAIIEARETEIRGFKPKEYYGLDMVANGFKFIWQDKSNNTRTFEKPKAESILSSVKGKEAKVSEVKKVSKKSYAKNLYDLTELQRECNTRFGYSPKETLGLVQRLYESYKVLTYPRTDSRYLTSDMVGTLKDRVKACAIGDLSRFSVKINSKEIKASKSFIDNSKVSDHHAIIPTEQRVDFSIMGDKERKVYDLVARRFLAVLLPPCEYEEVSASVNMSGEEFKTKGTRIISLGFKEVYNGASDDDDIKDVKLPDLKQGEILKVTSINITSGKTKAPARFTEATLLSAMENPVKFMQGDSAELKKKIGETGGLGTVATRADIIEKLFNSFLIEKNGKDLTITSKGKQLLGLVPSGLKTPTLTASWEQKLSQIEKGKLQQKDFLKEMREYSKAVVAEIKGAESKFVHNNLTRNKCSECGKFMLEVNGKKGKMLVCQDRECGHRDNVSMITNARCPECKKKLELRGKKGSSSYICNGCGFKEKEEVFKKRFTDKKSKVSKKEVGNLMRKMNKEAEEDINNPFADLLKNFK